MATDHSFLAKLKGPVPEQFIFVTLADGRNPADGPKPKEHSKPMSEEEARTALHDVAMPEVEIIARIDHARKNPI